jgi:uncharacterized protein YndB with AHSA1/START domain
MRSLSAAALTLSALWASAAQAEVKHASAEALRIEHAMVIAAKPAEVFRGLGRIDRWWAPAHTWSGDTRNLSLGLRAGDCYCERWKDGSAEHGRVVMSIRDKTLRLHATLGPFLEMAVSGVLSFVLEPIEGGTRLTVTYRISGDAEHGFDKFGAVVDGVIGEQVVRLKRYLETGVPQ